MSNAIAAVGTVLKRESVAVAEIRNITGPGFTRDLIEVTSLDSTGGWKEFISGFADGGECVLTANWTLAGFGVMLADFNSGDAHTYTITLTNTEASIITFEALVTSMPMTINYADAVTVEYTLRITGEVDLTS